MFNCKIYYQKLLNLFLAQRNNDPASNVPPPYQPPTSHWYAAPPPAYEAPTGYYGWVPPTSVFPDMPPG